MALKPITVSQLNTYADRILRTDPILGSVSVKGEISNLKIHSVGHIYFSLKDESSRLNCFMPSSAASKLRYAIENGIEIVAHGYVAVYKAGGYYSLNVRDIEVSGEGSLAAAFKAMYKKLESEGIFDAKRKKKIPEFPQNVAIVTSPTGAAVRDIIKIIKSRNSLVNVTVFPCLVQGASAAADISGTIDMINERFPDTDVIIAGRGGGSQEDLWAFNEELVARAIFRSEIPIISAVGHETDFSISDFAADMRAETPTAAAAAAVPNIYDMMERASELKRLLWSRLKRSEEYHERLLESRTPGYFLSILSQKAENLDHGLRRLNLQISAGIAENVMRREFETVTAYSKLDTDAKNKFRQLEYELEKLNLRIESGSPQRTFSRGYAALFAEDGDRMIRSVDEVSKGQTVNVMLADGRIKCEVISCRRNEI